MNQACDQLKERPLEPGYSQQIEAGRSEVLSHIRSTLIQCKRIPLEQREHETSMPAELLPACLALLVEVGGVALPRLQTDKPTPPPRPSSLGSLARPCAPLRVCTAGGTERSCSGAGHRPAVFKRDCTLPYHPR